jgi:hypothetical protein
MLMANTDVIAEILRHLQRPPPSTLDNSTGEAQTPVADPAQRQLKRKNQITNTDSEDLLTRTGTVRVIPETSFLSDLSYDAWAARESPSVLSDERMYGQQSRSPVPSGR